MVLGIWDGGGGEGCREKLWDMVRSNEKPESEVNQAVQPPEMSLMMIAFPILQGVCNCLQKLEESKSVPIFRAFSSPD